MEVRTRCSGRADGGGRVRRDHAPPNGLSEHLGDSEGVHACTRPEPVQGWQITLEARGIEVVEDDLLRPSIRREDARRLVQERREWERSSAEEARRRQESLEGPPVPAGIPAQEGSTPFEAMVAADASYASPQAEFGGRPRPRLLEEAIEAGARQQAAARAETAARKAKDR